MDVGMEGHGVWRSETSACEPGVHYRKEELLCVCTEDGSWPNPVCRDIFQVLHSVELTDRETPLTNDTCSPTKLYLYGCNVCFCPSTGRIDHNLCTKRKCTGENVERSHVKDYVEEAYATCTPVKRYRLGCQTCVCLRNNRLLCDNCTAQENIDMIILQNTACHGKKPGVTFQKDCNLCHCDRKDTIYCSAKNCLPKHTNISLPKVKYDLVDQTPDDYNCVPGSKYETDCNTCHCFMLDGVKYFGCSLKSCKRSPDSKPERDCVVGTSYQANCLICHCVMDDGVKREFCTIDDTCRLDEIGSLRGLSTMHGYCEPMHFYQQECNKCRCLADGKTVACTSKLCFRKKPTNKEKQQIKDKPIWKSRVDPKLTTTEKSMVMEFIPFIQKDNFCPKGHTYMVDCNICYCMETGNAVCTTKVC